MQNNKVNYIYIKFLYSFSILIFIIIIFPQFIDKLFRFFYQGTSPSGNSVLVNSINSRLNYGILEVFLLNVKRIIFFM